MLGRDGVEAGGGVGPDRIVEGECPRAGLLAAAGDAGERETVVDGKPWRIDSETP